MLAIWIARERLRRFRPGLRACFLEPGLDEHSDPESDDSFGSYKIICQIGQGGMGIVYLAALHQKSSISGSPERRAGISPGTPWRPALENFSAHPNI